MINSKKTIDADTLRNWLENKEPVYVLDVRPPSQREEWQIPGSHYLDAYERLNEGDKSVMDEIDIPGNPKVVTVCAAGRISQVASEALIERGFDAVSLEGGMKAWSKAWNAARKEFAGFEVLQVRRTGKGCLSYIISSNKEAIIIDASLPAGVYEELVHQHDLSVRFVIDTHIHADHLSRSKQVAELFNAPLFLPAPNKVQFDHNPITGDPEFSLGAIKLKAIATPGHTLESYSFYITDKIVITGDTLFTNGVGIIINDGKEIATNFVVENCFFTYTEGISINVPSHKHFIALEDCEMLFLDKQKLPLIFSVNPKFETLLSQLLADELRNVLLNEQKIKTESAEARYLAFINSFPDAFNRIPLKYIAGFLGIEAPSLSRLRKRLAGK